MPDITATDLSAFRIEQAAERLQAAERDMAANDFKGAANRSYYSIFYSMKAVLALDEFDSKNHGNIIGKFREKYIKTGIFPVEYSDVIRDAFVVRNDCDYQDFYVVSKSEVSAQVENAQNFLFAVKEYLSERS